MSGPYSVRDNHDGTWSVMGGHLPIDDGIVIVNLPRAEHTREALNAAHAAGVAAERKRVVAQLRSRLDGGITAVDVYMQLAAELEKEQP